MCSAPKTPDPVAPTAPVESPKAMALPDNATPLGLAALRIGGQSFTTAAAKAASPLALGTAAS